MKTQRPTTTPSSSDTAIVSAPATSSVAPLVCRPRTKSGPALSPTTATNPVSPIDSKTHSVGPGMRPKKRGLTDRSQPQTQPAEQHADRQAQTDLDASDVHRRQARSARRATMPVATTNMSVASVARSATPMRSTARVDIRERADDRDDIAAIDDGLRAARAIGTPPRAMRRRNTPRAASSCASSASGRPCSALFVTTTSTMSPGSVEELLVVDLAQSIRPAIRAPRPASCGVPTPRRHRRDAACGACRSPGPGRGCAVSTKMRCAAGSTFEITDRAADPFRSDVDGVGSQLEFPARRDLARLAAEHALLELRAFVGEVDAHQFRRELREHPRRAGHADQVGHRKRDRDVVGHRGAGGFGRIEPRDRVHRGADRRGFGATRLRRGRAAVPAS